MKLGIGKIKDVLKSGAGKSTESGREEQKIEEIEPDRVEEATVTAKISEQESENTPEKEHLVPMNGTECKKTGLIFFPAFDWAISPTHPEREERLLYTRDQIFEEGLMDLPQIAEYKPRLAEFKDIARVHFCVPDIKAQATTPHLIALAAARQPMPSCEEKLKTLSPSSALRATTP